MVNVPASSEEELYAPAAGASFSSSTITRYRGARFPSLRICPRMARA
jgi:hypothetical protein